MDTVYFRGKRYDTETLNGMTSGELVALYNAVSSKPVARFATRAKAIIRVWNALQAYAVDVVTDKSPSQSAELGKQIDKKAKSPSQVDELLRILREHQDGLTVDAIAAELGCGDARRVRGLIDRARSKHGKQIIKNVGAGTFAFGVEA